MPKTLIVPWNHLYTFRCPSCRSLATEWHPDAHHERLGWGKCHAVGCGITWRMDGRKVK